MKEKYEYKTIEQLEKMFIEDMQEMYRSDSFMPCMAALGYHKDVDNPQNVIAILPLPKQIFESRDFKEKFFEEIIPTKIAPKMNEKFEIKAVMLCTEASVRVTKADEFDPTTDNFKDLPIKYNDVLFFLFDNGVKTKTNVFEIIKPTVVNSKGEMEYLDTVFEIVKESTGDSQVEEGAITGLMSGLFTKFKP